MKDETQSADSTPDIVTETKQENTKPVLLFGVTQAMWLEPQRYIVQLAEHLSQDYSIHVVFGTFEFTGKNLLQEKIEALGGVVHTIDPLGHKNVLANEISTFFALWKLFRKIKPVVYHANDGKTALFGGLSAALSGVKRTVATIHGYPDISGMKGAEVGILNFFIKLSYGRVSQIIVRDAHTSSWATPMFGSRKVNLILPGISEVNFTQRAEKLRAIAQDAPAEISGYLQEQSTLIIGNVGPLDADQGIAYTLHAISLLKEKGVTVVYIHYGDGDQKHLLEHELSEFGITDRVLFKGIDKMASSYFPIFDVVVHPTLRPGVPAIVRDLAQAEKALVITDVIGVTESLEDKKEAIIIPQGDSQAIADALEMLAGDKPARDSLGQAIKERIERDYSKEAMFEKTIQLYR